MNNETHNSSTINTLTAFAFVVLALPLIGALLGLGVRLFLWALGA